MSRPEFGGRKDKWLQHLWGNRRVVVEILFTSNYPVTWKASSKASAISTRWICWLNCGIFLSQDLRHGPIFHPVLDPSAVLPTYADWLPSTYASKTEKETVEQDGVLAYGKVFKAKWPRELVWRYSDKPTYLPSNLEFHDTTRPFENDRHDVGVSCDQTWSRDKITSTLETQKDRHLRPVGLTHQESTVNA